jgi:hypothetical protein
MIEQLVEKLEPPKLKISSCSMGENGYNILILGTVL